MTTNQPQAPAFYFAFPRLIQRLLGGTALRGENNWIEAYGTGVVMYLISYFYAVGWFELRRDFWLSLLALLPLAFGMWVFWLVVVYLNSLIIRGLRVAGWLDRASKAAAQSVLLTALTTFFAFDLARLNSIVRWLALSWFVILTLNLVSALILMFVDQPGTTEHN